MDYELRILKDSKVVTLDLLDETIPFTYQLGTLGEISERNLDYSQAISLARSPHNMQALDFFALPEVEASSVARNTYPAAILAGGVQISPVGAVLIIDSVTKDSIEGQVVGGLTSILDELEEESMDSTEEEGFWRRCSANNLVQTPTELDNGVKHYTPVVSLVKGADVTQTDITPEPPEYITHAGRLMNFLNYWDIVAYILSTKGYTMEMKTSNSTYPQMAYLPVHTPVLVASATFDPLTGQIVGNVGLYPDEGGETSVYYTINSSSVDGFCTIMSPSGYPSNNAYIYALVGGKLTITASCNHEQSTQSATARLTVSRYSSDGTYIDSVQIGSWTQGGRSYSHTWDSVNEGDYFDVRCYVTSSTAEVTARWLAEIVIDVELEEEAEEDTDADAYKEFVPAYAYDMLAGLGFDNRRDAVESFIKVFGFFAELDEGSKVLRLHTFTDVHNNWLTRDLQDWSGKLVEDDDMEIAYHPDNYGQSNTLTFAENEDDDYTSSITYTISDKSLDLVVETEFDFLSIKTYYVDNGSGYRISMPNIPILDYSDEDEDDPDWDAPSLPCLFYGNATTPYRELTLTEGQTTSKFTPYLIASLLCGNATTNYMPIYETCMSSYMKVTAHFALTLEDIRNLDLTKPVWIDKWKRVFYISKVSNFQEGELTEVELIKIY